MVLKSKQDSSRVIMMTKNTIMLYFRSLIVLLVSVYTSRVLLATLGVDDYGLYNIVGGIVVIFNSLKSVLSASVQRFINYEKGKGHKNRVGEIFATSVFIHIILGVLFIIVVEIFGGYYVHNYLILPIGKLSEATFVFHCSVLTAFLSIITIPYDAIVVANEKFSFYAYVSICDAIIKLLIVLLLPNLPYRYLCSYAVLMLLASFIMRLVSVLYSMRFSETKIKLLLKKDILLELSKFSFWNFFGCFVFSVVEEGVNMLFNYFGGVIANAARAIANQLRSVVNVLLGNIVTATQPFITQKAAIVNKEVFWEYIYMQSRMVFYITILTILPIYLFAEEILFFWLKSIPDGTVDFVKAILIYTVVMSLQKPLDLAFKANNCMKIYQLVDAIVLLLALPIIFVALKKGLPLYYAFFILSIIRCIDYFFILLIAKYKLNLKICQYIQKVILPFVYGVIIVIIVIIVISSFSVFLPIPNFLLLLLKIVIACTITITLFYFLVIERNDRLILKNIFFNLCNKFIKK